MELPSDSTFAIAMKTQQAAEREEQQRIKSLVLNYDLHDGEEQDGDLIPPPLDPNPNIHTEQTGPEKATATNYTRPDKSGINRSGQRARKLQLSDVDWYDSKNHIPQSENKISRDQYGSQSFLGTHRGMIPLGPRRQPAVLPNSLANQQRGRNFSSAKTGRLTRKEMLIEHAKRNAASKLEGEK